MSISNDQPLVTIVIPTYNGEEYVADAVSSALAQTHKKLEVLVTDDASTDSTRDVVRRFGDPRLRILRNQHNLGLVKNLNRGFRAATGELICWLNQDDFFYPDKVERQIDLMGAIPTVGACFCQKDDVDQQGRLISRFNPSEVRIAEKDHLVQLFGGCYLSAPSVMIRRDVYHLIGGFDESYTIAFDYDMWFRLKKRYDFKVIYESLMAFRHHPDNLSAEKNQPTVAAECARVVKKALALFTIEEIYPFLSRIEDANNKKIETSICLLSLAILIWHQKKWNLLLGKEIFWLTESALTMNPSFLEALEFACKIGPEAAIRLPLDACHEEKRSLENRYQALKQMLRQAFLQKDQTASREIIQKMYAMYPLNGDPYFQVASLYHEIGEDVSALEYCKHATLVNQNHLQARNLTATIQGK